jgi:hypothetical protein
VNERNAADTPKLARCRRALETALPEPTCGALHGASVEGVSEQLGDQQLQMLDLCLARDANCSSFPDQLLMLGKQSVLSRLQR